MRVMRDCRECGGPFERSPADYTVNCPACRKPPPEQEQLQPCVTCLCGKTVIRDSFGARTYQSCPRYYCKAERADAARKVPA